MEKRPKPVSLSSPPSTAWFHLLMRARPPNFSGKLLEGRRGGGGKDLAFLRRFKAHNKNALRTGAAAVQWWVAYFSQKYFRRRRCRRPRRRGLQGRTRKRAETDGTYGPLPPAEEREESGEGQVASGGGDGGGRIP